MLRHIVLDIPVAQEFLEPQWRALKELGSATLDELAEWVANDMGLNEEQTSLMHKNGPRHEYEYRMAWARTYLKKTGYVTNPRMGLWTNTTQGNLAESIDAADIISQCRKMDKENREAKKKLYSEDSSDEDPTDFEIHEDESEWMDLLIAKVMDMSPTAFEKLCRRLLQEVGFEDVKVTKQSNDGGVDGHGKLRTKDLFTQQVAFQSKRYKPGNTLGSKIIREFRGSIEGKTTMGVIITTSSFTKEARKEAVRPGARAINLLNGTELCDLMKKYNIGVKTSTKEEVSIESDFFDSLG